MSLRYQKAESRGISRAHTVISVPIVIPSESVKQIIYPKISQDLYKYVPLSKHGKENTKIKPIQHSQSANRVTDTHKKYRRSTRNIIRVSGHSPIKKNDNFILHDSLPVHHEPTKLYKTIYKPKHSSESLLKPYTLSPIQDLKLEKLRGIKKNIHLKPFIITRNESIKYLTVISLESSKSPTMKYQSITQYSTDRSSSFLSKPDYKMKNSSLPSVSRSLSAPKFTVYNEVPKLKEPEPIPDVYIHDCRITELGSDEEEVPLLKYTPRYNII